MKILGIESSGRAASAAIVTDGAVTAEYGICHDLTHSVTLLPMVDEMFVRTQMTLTDMDAIAVSAGPGSFTGLRIGATLAKGLCLASEKPLVAVPTLEALAYNVAEIPSQQGNGRRIASLIDARRSQVYAACFEATDGLLKELRAGEALAITDFLSYLNGEKAPVVFVGDGATAYLEEIKKGCEVPYQIAPAQNNAQRASSVALLGERYLEKGMTVDADAFAPTYLRASQAERMRQERSVG